MSNLWRLYGAPSGKPGRVFGEFITKELAEQAKKQWEDLYHKHRESVKDTQTNLGNVTPIFTIKAPGER